MAEQKKNHKPGANTNKPSNKSKANAKPWEKMNSNKSGTMTQNTAVKGKEKKKAPEYRSFLLLLPKKTSAKDLAKTLTFLDKKDVEIWEEECILEITTQKGTITFEDIKDSLEKEDKAVLNDLRMKQVIACDYSSEDAAIVRRIMEILLETFGGKLATDSEDFTPFLTVEEL